MRRAWPYALAVLGATALAVGWWLYAHIQPVEVMNTFSSDCRARELYDDILMQVRDISPCGAELTQLYWSLGLLSAGLTAFLIGWFTAVGRHVADLAARKRLAPSVISLVPLIALCLTVYGGYETWQWNQERRAQARLDAADRVLQGKALPAGLLPGRQDGPCAPYERCAHSTRFPKDLESKLASLLDKDKRLGAKQCPAVRTGDATCNLTLWGRVGGHPATIYASPHLIRVEKGQRPPPGAVRWNAKPVWWAYGSNISIVLFRSEE